METVGWKVAGSLCVLILMYSKALSQSGRTYPGWASEGWQMIRKRQAESDDSWRGCNDSKWYKDLFVSNAARRFDGSKEYNISCKVGAAASISMGHGG